MEKELAITNLANLLEGREFTNIAGDAGRGTCWGVTQAVYDRYRQAHGLPAQSVSLITWPEADWIYDAWYWTPAGCRELPDGLDFSVFQWVVNTGVARGVKDLQRALGFKGDDVDGYLGPVTLAAAQSAARPDIEVAFLKQQHQRYTALEKANSEDLQFAEGWDNRIRRTAKLINLDPALLSFLEVPPVAAAPQKKQNPKAA